MFRLDSRPAVYLLLLALWAVLSLPNLGGPSLWDIDEGNNAECSREMDASGNLIVPTFNYQLREDKPALIYWLQIACSRLVGVNEWSARLPSAFAALLTLLAVYELGRRMFAPGAALLGSIILATSFAFLGASHFANPDALLLASVTLALTLFWHDFQTAGKGSLVAVGIVAGLAVLSKGPIGLAMPAGIAVVFLIWQRRLGYLWDRRGPWFWFAFVFTAVPWYALVAAETRGAWIIGFWKRHHADRVMTAMETHSGPIVYYLPVLLVGLAPWSIFLGTAGWQTWKRLREGEDDERSAIRLLLVWFVLTVAFFSLVSTKLPNYILPCYPPAALLMGHFLDRWRRGEASVPHWLMRVSFLCLALFGAVVVVALLVAGGVGKWSISNGLFYPGLVGWAWLGLLLIAGACVASWMLDRGRRGAALASVAVSGTVFAALLLMGTLNTFDEHKPARGLAAMLPADHEQREVRLAALRWFQPSLVFYSRREVERLERIEAAQMFLGQRLPAYLFVPESVWNEVRPQMPDSARIVGRRTDLYSGKTILVVTNEPGSRTVARSER